MKEATFSVIIVTWNQGKFVKDAIESVLKQSFQDFEIIVIDDGSTDDTKDKVLSFTDKRINYVYQGHSGLPAYCRNRGVSLSRGKLIAFFDADDLWYGEKLKSCLRMFDEHPDVSLVCHNVAITKDGKVLRISNYGPYVEGMYENLLFNGNCLTPSAVVIKREVFFQDGMWFSETRDLFSVEDYDFWLRLSKRFKFYFLKETLGEHRLVITSTVANNIERHMSNLLNLLEENFKGIIDKDNKTKLLIKKRISSVLAAKGRLYHDRRKFSKSLENYIKALKVYPLNYKIYFYIFLSLLRWQLIYS